MHKGLHQLRVASVVLVLASCAEKIAPVDVQPIPEALQASSPLAEAEFFIHGVGELEGFVPLFQRAFRKVGLGVADERDDADFSVELNAAAGSRQLTGIRKGRGFYDSSIGIIATVLASGDVVAEFSARRSFVAVQEKGEEAGYHERLGDLHATAQNGVAVEIANQTATSPDVEAAFTSASQ